MKRLLIASLGLLAVAAPAHAQVYPERIIAKAKARVVTTAAYQRRDRDDNREEQIERTTKTFRLGANGSLALSNISGDIVVTRGAGSDTTVDIVKTARGRDVNDAKALLQIVTVEAVERNGRADVKTHYPSGDEMRRNNRRNLSVSVAYTVTTPAETRVSVESISGDVKVTDIKGDLTVNTVSGDVRIGGAGRLGSAKSISGSVEIADTKTDGGLSSSSISGDVIMRRVSAQRVDATSVSGEIKLEDVQSERVSASTTSGNITYTGTLARNGHYSLKGFSGDVRLMLSGNTGFEVDGSTFSGNIRPDYPGFTIRGARTGRSQSISGSVGDGSAVLDLQTFSGNIVISKR
jgi:hypothetical protein